jgi:hypothetical protein
LQKKYLRALEQKEKVMERDFQKSHNRAMMNEEKKYHSLLKTHELHGSVLDQEDKDSNSTEGVDLKIYVGGGNLGMSGPRCR